MIINIEDKDYKLNFGIKFIKQLDTKYTQVVNGVKYGIGLDYLMDNLRQYNPTILAQGIRYAAGISEVKAEAYIDSLDEHELEDLFDNFLQKLKEAPATRLAVKRYEEKSQMSEKMMEQLAKMTGDLNI